MTALRLTAVILGLAFAASLVWGFAQGGSVVPLLDVMLAEPWGVVTLADLYLGFVLAAGLILVLEPGRPAGLAWAVAVILLGNLVTAAWIALRLPAAVERLRQGT